MTKSAGEEWRMLSMAYIYSIRKDFFEKGLNISEIWKSPCLKEKVPNGEVQAHERDAVRYRGICCSRRARDTDRGFSERMRHAMQLVPQSRGARGYSAKNGEPGTVPGLWTLPGGLPFEHDVHCLRTLRFRIPRPGCADCRICNNG